VPRLAPLLLIPLLSACLAHAPELVAGPDTVSVAGDHPSWPVTVLEDEWGIPHVFARSEVDLAFALGWLHAEERLWQMETTRRVGAGTLSEILGRRTLKTDRFLRTVGFARAARSALETLPEAERLLLEAYADGVNAWVASTEELPYEFRFLRFEPEPWTPVDSLVQTKVMAWWLTGTARTDATWDLLVRELGVEQAGWLIPAYPGDGPRILPGDQMKALRGHFVAPPRPAIEPIPTPPATEDAEPPPAEGRSLPPRLPDGDPFPGLLPGVGSNSWVVHGSRTATGAPILSNDPHLAVQVPSTWYLAELHAPGLHAVGSTLPGLPGVVIGHNEHIAWGLTNSGVDVLDLVREQLDPEDPLRVRRVDGWERLEVVTEQIAVRGRAKPVELEIRIGSNGPLVTGLFGDQEAEHEIALRWTGLEPEDTTLSAMLGVMRARDWQEFLAALSLYVVPSQNFVYADRDGHVGWKVPGRIPVRGGWDGQGIGRGWVEQDAWQGWLPFDEQPEAFDPLQGWIVTANNRPTPDDYPHHLGVRFSAPQRAERIIDLLEQGEGRDVAGHRGMQLDVLSPLALELLPVLRAVHPQDDLETAALSLLGDWDGSQAADSAAAALFNAWQVEAGRLLVKDRLKGRLWGRLYALHPELLLEVFVGEAGALCQHPGGRGRPATQSCADVSALALTRAVRLLKRKQGADHSGWSWGELHPLRWHHPLAITPTLRKRLDTVLPSGGGNATVNVAAFSYRAPFDNVHFPSYRQVIDLADWSRSVWIHGPGQSGVSWRAHYRDLAEPYAAGEMLPMVFGREEAEARAVRRRQIRR
jgi:penicillin G amidase